MAALVVALLAGLCLILYPPLSDLWNSHVQSRVVASYAEAVDDMDETEKTALLESARAYNDELAARDYRWRLSDDQKADYEAQLNVTGEGVMGYVDIPKIGVELPIYHGASEAVLTVGVGHIEGSSLPVGGRGTHAVISGHWGLPSATLFTDIDQLAEGDVFYLRVLDEVLAYEVDQILTVEPGDLSALAIDEGEDLCTLVTCTPYGINTHRLLVRGHRTTVPADVASTAPEIDNTVFVAASVLGLVAVAVTVAALALHHCRKAGEAAVFAPRHAAPPGRR